MTVRLSHAPLRRAAWLGGVSASALMVAGVLSATAAHAAGTDLAGANLAETFNASVVDPNQPYTNSGATATLTLTPNGAGIIVQENAGAISGPINLTINGAGDVALLGANTYTGATSIQQGTLTLGNANAIGSSSVTLGNNTTLEATVSTTVNGETVSTGASATFEAAAGQSLTLGGTTNLNGGVGTTLHFGSASDTGTVVLATTGGTAANGQALSIDGGTLKIATNVGVLSSFTAGWTIKAGATLDVDGVPTGPWNLTGSGTITNSSGTLTRVVMENSVNTTFAGVIKDGTGGILVDINGPTGSIITFTGANTYTGQTTIYTGNTLQIGNGGTTGSIAGNVDTFGNGTLIFDRSDTYTFAGSIVGTGALYQIGTGDLILTGNNVSYIGAVTVGAGTLEVDGSLANASSVTVNAGGKLSGTGLVDPPLATTTIMSGGTLAPGNAANPAGTLTIGGNLAFQSGAFYLVQTAGGAASNTTVGGTATLAGTVQVSFLGGASNRTYDILHAAGGLGGTTFNSLSASNANFGAASLSYTATDVFLNLTTAMLGDGTPLNQNQQNVATVINSVFNNGGTLPGNFGALFGLTGAPLANALSQLDGEDATGAQKSAFQLMSDFLNLMLDPSSGTGSQGNASGGGATGFAPEQDTTLPPEIASAYSAMLTKAPPKPQTFEQRWSTWGSAFGGSSKTNGDPVVGTNNITANDYGFAGGMDYRYAPGTTFGFAVAGGGTNWGLAQGLGSGRSDAAQAGVYAKTHFGPAYLSAALAFTNNWFTTNRTSALGDQLQGKFQGQSYGGRLEAGYRYGLPSANYLIGFTPYAAVQAQSLHTSAFSEADLTAGGFGLNFAAMNATDTRSELGLRADDLTLFGATPLILRGRLAWAHDWITNPALNAAFQLLPGSGFTVNGAASPKDSALTSVSAELRMTQNWSLLGKFDGQFGSGSQTYGGTGTLRYSW